MAFSDAAALEEAYQCLVNEMGGLRSTTPNLEEIAGSSKVNPSLTTLCGKEFDLWVHASISQRILGVDVTVEKQQYLQQKNIDRHEDPLRWREQNSFHLP